MKNWKEKEGASYRIWIVLPLGFYFLVFRREDVYALSNSFAAGGLCCLAAGCFWRAKKSGFFSAAVYGFQKFKAIVLGDGSQGEPYQRSSSSFRWREEGMPLAAGAAYLLASILTI